MNLTSIHKKYVGTLSYVKTEAIVRLLTFMWNKGRYCVCTYIGSINSDLEVRKEKSFENEEDIDFGTLCSIRRSEGQPSLYYTLPNGVKGNRKKSS